MDVVKKANKGRIINSVVRPEENLCHKLAKITRKQILHRSGNIAFLAVRTMCKFKLIPYLCSTIIYCYPVNTEQGKCRLINEYPFFPVFNWPLVL